MPPDGPEPQVEGDPTDDDIAVGDDSLHPPFHDRPETPGAAVAQRGNSIDRRPM
jgi:hypothetical protein